MPPSDNFPDEKSNAASSTAEEATPISNQNEQESERPIKQEADVDEEPEEDEDYQPSEGPQPSPWKRRALILFICTILWVAFRVVTLKTKPKPSVVHANRYSNEFKYRPAASPIITETLKDGRTRLRGASPTTVPVLESKPKPTAKARKSGKKGGKKNKKKKTAAEAKRARSTQ